jgi:hypothetical protein
MIPTQGRCNLLKSRPHTPEEATITAWAGGRWPEMATFVEGLQAPP